MAVPPSLSAYMSKKRVLWKQLSPSHHAPTKDVSNRRSSGNQSQQQQQHQGQSTATTAAVMLYDNSNSSNNNDEHDPSAPMASLSNLNEDTKEQDDTNPPVTAMSQLSLSSLPSSPAFGIRPAGAWRSKLPRRGVSPLPSSLPLLPAIASASATTDTNGNNNDSTPTDGNQSSSIAFAGERTTTSVLQALVDPLLPSPLPLPSSSPLPPSSLAPLSSSSSSNSKSSLGARAAAATRARSNQLLASQSSPSLLSPSPRSSLPSSSATVIVTSPLPSTAAPSGTQTTPSLSSSQSLSLSSLPTGDHSSTHRSARSNSNPNGVILPPVPLVRPSTPQLGGMTPAAAATVSTATPDNNEASADGQTNAPTAATGPRSALRGATLMMFGNNVNVDAARVAAADRHRVSSPVISSPATSPPATADGSSPPTAAATTAATSSPTGPSIQWYNDEHGVVDEHELYVMEQKERAAKAVHDAMMAASASSPQLDRRASPLLRSVSSPKAGGSDNNERPSTANKDTIATPTKSSAPVPTIDSNSPLHATAPSHVLSTPLPPSSSAVSATTSLSHSRALARRHTPNINVSPNGTSHGGRPPGLSLNQSQSLSRLNSPTRPNASSLLRSLTRTRSPDRNNGGTTPTTPVIPLSPFQLGTPLTLPPTSLTVPISDEEAAVRPTALEDLRVARKGTLPHSLLELLYRPNYEPHWLPVSLPPTMLARLPTDALVDEQLQLEMQQFTADAQAYFNGNGGTVDDEFNNTMSSLLHGVPSRDVANRSLMTRSSSTSSIIGTSNGVGSLDLSVTSIDGMGNNNGVTGSAHDSYGHYRPGEGDRILMAAGRPRLGTGDTPRDAAAKKANEEARVIAHMRRHEDELRRRRAASHQRRMLPLSATAMAKSSAAAAVAASTSSSLSSNDIGARVMPPTATPSSQHVAAP